MSGTPRDSYVTVPFFTASIDALRAIHGEKLAGTGMAEFVNALAVAERIYKSLPDNVPSVKVTLLDEDGKQMIPKDEKRPQRPRNTGLGGEMRLKVPERCDVRDPENGACAYDYDGTTLVQRTCKWLCARGKCPATKEG